MHSEVVCALIYVCMYAIYVHVHTLLSLVGGGGLLLHAEVFVLMSETESLSLDLPCGSHPPTHTLTHTHMEQNENSFVPVRNGLYQWNAL